MIIEYCSNAKKAKNVLLLKILEDNEIVQTLCFGVKKGEKYPEKVRQFCLTVQYKSTSTYNYLRSVFNDNLPHIKTIQQWYANSDVSAEEGISGAHIGKLVRIVEDHKEAGKTDLLCALSFDEMSIRQQILWNTSKCGYDGFVSNCDEPERVKQAKVFLLNGINYCLEFPVAYWLIRTLDKHQKKDLLLNVLEAVTNTGVQIKVITFDGYATNIPMCEMLGADLQEHSPDFHTFFVNPYNNEKVFIMLDPCHMIKLVRNTLANKGTLYNEDKIEWRYLVALTQFSKSHNFQTHKMNKKHLQWVRNQMNVRLAVQTMSNSVAQSLQVLMEEGHPDFAGAGPTIEFVRLMNCLFDVFNTKSLLDKNIFKKALHSENKRIVFDFLEKSLRYLKGLKISQIDKKGKLKVVPILKSRNKVGFRGFLIDIHSLMQFYIENVEEKNAIVTYSLLQDFIEMFFGRIRSSNGHNNNPNIQQFKGAYRKLLCNIKIAAPSHGNCRIFGEILPDGHKYSNVFTVTSRRTQASFQSIEEQYDQQSGMILEDMFKIDAMKIADPLLGATTNFSIAFLASQIEELLLSMQFDCEECANVFDENERNVDFRSYNTFRSPCQSTYKICKHVDKYLSLHDIRRMQTNCDFRVIYCLIFRTIDLNSLFINSKFDCGLNHKYQIIKWIVKIYIDKKSAYIANEMTLDQYDKILRQQLNRLVLFAGQ